MSKIQKTTTSRRNFLKAATMGAGILAMPAITRAQERRTLAKLPDVSFDVVVVGGGPAGVCAAVAAKRNGTKTLLIERGGLLGGMLTAGHVDPVLGMTGPGTMADELALRISIDGKLCTGQTKNGREIYVDVEYAKTGFFNFVAESGLACWLQSLVVDTDVDAKGNITSLLVGTPQGLRKVFAKTVVDATGDGSVAAFSGADYEFGREDGLVQPVSLEFVVSNLDESRAITAWGTTDPAKMPSGQRYAEFCKEACARGELPKNVSIVRLHRTAHQGERSVNATQANGVNPLVPSEVFSSTLELRNQIDQVLKFLRKNVPGFENAVFKSSGAVLGVRESRRIIGQYVLGDEDLAAGSDFEDAAVRKAWFLIDIHNPAGGGQAEKFARNAKPYDIPLRSLIPLKPGNLLLSGRCISGTHRAHASYRVMMICMATGQAAGTAAALCARNNLQPAKLPYAQVRAALEAQGVSFA